MTCAPFEANLSAFLDGELRGAERAELAVHLEGCAPCRERLDELKELSSLLKRRLAVAAPAGLAARALRAAEPSAWSWARPAFGLAFAAACVTLVFNADRLRGPRAPESGLPTGPAFQTQPVPLPGARPAPEASRLEAAARAPAAKTASPAAPRAKSRRIESAAAPMAKAWSPSAATAGGAANMLPSNADEEPARTAPLPSGTPTFPGFMLPLPMEARARMEAAQALQRGNSLGMQAAYGSGAGSLEPDAETAPDAGPTWTGTALFAPTRDERVVIRDMQGWINFWPLHSMEPLPLVDFGGSMVVGVVAAPGSRWEGLSSVEERDGKIKVRLRRARGRASAGTFELKAVPQSDLPVEFSEK